MADHIALVREILKSLGHATPPDSDLDSAFKNAFKKLKEEGILGSDESKYKISLTEVNEEWVKSTFSE